MRTEITQAQASRAIEGLNAAFIAGSQSICGVPRAGQSAAKQSDARGDTSTKIKEGFGEWTSAASGELLVLKLIDG
jgi:hypothetical protein